MEEGVVEVIPLLHPVSWGNYSHWIPVLSTKTIPVRHARSGIRGRPSFSFGPGFGNNGSTLAHRSSLTSGLAMPMTPRDGCHFW